VKVLGPEHDAVLLGFGIGFTDVVKVPSANVAALDPAEFARWAPRLLARLRRHAPRVACFHGVTAYRGFVGAAFGAGALAEMRPPPGLGAQREQVGTTRLYVVPNPSPANAHFTVDDQRRWYDRLAAYLRISRAGIRVRQ